MCTKTLTGASYLLAVRCGASRLKTNKETINNLNVFPIPDGDTGDNMLMTISAGIAAADADSSVAKVSSAVAGGMLLGARGNSGVILSRIFSGISKGLKGVGSASVSQFSDAMACAVKEAYGAVSEPVEGTLLTVLKDGVRVAADEETDCFEDYFRSLVAEMEASLERTPELLAVLKEAGVIDSGGAGLLCIAKGMEASLNGEHPEDIAIEKKDERKINLDAFSSESCLTFGYCTEFLLRLQSAKLDIRNFDESVIADYLNSVGESVVCFREGSIVKVHVHTKKPGDILNQCQQWGEYLTLKIENMNLQHSARVGGPDLKVDKYLGVVAVASGEGLASSFRAAGVDVVIEGGQTMNPSAQAFIDAFDSISAQHIVVLPNNSNIILTAQQAAQLYKKSDVRVVMSKNLGAGYIAAASIDHSQRDIDKIVSEAAATCESTECVSVSNAVRNTTVNGVEVVSGSYISFASGNILSSGESASEAVLSLRGIGDHDVVILFYGSSVTGIDAASLVQTLQDRYPMTEFILNEGGQTVYDYILILC